jgi:integrase
MPLDVRGHSRYYSHMASLWKRERSKFWIACFTDASGRQLKRSTKTTDRKLATRLAEQFEQASRRKRTARQMREVMAGLHREIADEELPAVTVRAFFDGWFERKKHETAPATMAFYRGTAGKFVAFLGEEAGREIAEITSEHILRFRNALAATLVPRTVNHSLKGLRTIFKAARRDNVIFEDPTEFVQTIRQTIGDAKRRAFTIPELQAILAVADDEWRSLVKCGLYLGQRLADLATLTWANVDLDRGEIRLETRKTGRRMILPIAPPLRKHLESLPAGDKPDAPLHPRAFAIVAREGRSGSLSNQFADLLAQAGLREKKGCTSTGKGRNTRRESNALSFHSLRHSAATLLHEAGIPAAVAQSLIGHDDSATHNLYVNVGREALEKAAAALPEIL